MRVTVPTNCHVLIRPSVRPQQNTKLLFACSTPPSPSTSSFARSKIPELRTSPSHPCTLHPRVLAFDRYSNQFWHIYRTFCLKVFKFLLMWSVLRVYVAHLFGYHSGFCFALDVQCWKHQLLAVNYSYHLGGITILNGVLWSILIIFRTKWINIFWTKDTHRPRETN